MPGKETTKVKISNSGSLPELNSNSSPPLQKAPDKHFLKRGADMNNSKKEKIKKDKVAASDKHHCISKVSSIVKKPLQSLPSQEPVVTSRLSLSSTVPSQPKPVITKAILKPTSAALANSNPAIKNPFPSCSVDLSPIIPTSLIGPRMNSPMSMVPRKQYPFNSKNSNNVSSSRKQTSRHTPQSCLPVTNILRPISVVRSRRPFSSNRQRILTVVKSNAEHFSKQIYSVSTRTASSSSSVTTTVKKPISTAHLSGSQKPQNNSCKTEPTKQGASTSSTNRSSTKKSAHTAKHIYSSDSSDSGSESSSCSKPMDVVEIKKEKVEQNGHKHNDRRYSRSAETKKKIKQDLQSGSHSSASSANTKARDVSTSSKAVSCFIALSCASVLPHCDFNTFTTGYNCLNMIFKNLKISDLLSVAQVCRSWNCLASQAFLWEKVSLQGNYVRDWVKCTESLKKHGTKVLNLCGIHLDESGDPWKDFIKNLNNLSAIEHITFGQVPPIVLESTADVLPLLESLECHCLTATYKRPDLWSTPCKLKFFNLRFLRKLKKLKIRSAGGLLSESEPTEIKHLTNLQHLSLTSLKNFPSSHFFFVAQLPNLVSLELGDCCSWETKNYEIIGKLTNLRQLRLENGRGFRSELSSALLQLTKLEELELMKFEIPDDLGSAFEVLPHLCKLSLWPDNLEEQAAQNNYNAFQAATKAKHVIYFCWGILSPDDCIPLIPMLKDPPEVSHSSSNIVLDEVYYEDLFERLCTAMPDAKVEMKCISMDFLNEYCSVQR